MAPKHRLPLPSEEAPSHEEPAPAVISNQRKATGNPPPKKRADSDDDEESSDEESGSDAERSEEPPPSKTKPQIQQKPQHTPVPAPPRPAAKPADPSSEEDESSKEEDGPPMTHRRAQPKLPDSRKPEKSPSRLPKPKKSPLSTTAGADPQKKQQKHEAFSEPPSGSKRHPFQRLWGDEDVIAVLHGLLDYRFKKGALPASSWDFDSFLAFVRSSLSIVVNKLQLSEKIRHLKKRYESATARGKNGADPAFSKPHDREVFELSKKIWGAQNHGVEGDDREGDDDGDSPNATPITMKAQVHRAPIPTMVNGTQGAERGKSSHVYLQEAIDVLVREQPWASSLKRAYGFLDNSKAKVLDEKFKKQRQIEIKQHLRQMDLMKEAAKALFDALERAD